MDITEIPAECGLVVAGVAAPYEWKGLIRRQAGFFSFDPDTRHYCMITAPAPWRDTPGPTWQLGSRHAAESMAGNGGEAARAASPAASKSKRLLTFSDARGAVRRSIHIQLLRFHLRATPVRRIITIR